MPEATRVTHTLSGVEIFDVGTWNGKRWTDRDLDQMVANFAALGLEVPIKIGHSDKQELLEAEGLPAAGWITHLYRVGSKLAADIEDVPEEVFRLLQAKAYRNVSAEVWEKVRYGERTYENVLAAVAFLGAELPAVTTLGDILDRYGVRPHRLRPLAPAATFTVRFASAGPTAIPPHTTVKADEGASWDGGAVLRDLPEGDQRAWPKYFTYYDADAADEDGDGLPDAKSAWHLPHHNSDGAVVLAGVQAAGNVVQGARGAQVPATVEGGVKAHLARHYAQFARTAPWEAQESAASKQLPTTHAGASGETTKEEVMADITRITKALGLADGATEDQVLASIEALRRPTTAQATTREACETEGGTWDSEAGTCTMPDRAALAARVRELETRLAQRDAAEAVDAAVKARKLAPAQHEWAETYALKDPAGFKAYVKAAPEVLAAGERGSDGDAPEPESEVVQFRKLVAERAKGGMSIDEAQRQVAAEEPELFAAIRSRR